MKICIVNIVVFSIAHLLAAAVTDANKINPIEKKEPDWRILNTTLRVGKIISISWSNNSSCVFYRSATGGMTRSFFPAENRTVRNKENITGTTSQRHKRFLRHRRRWSNPDRIPSPNKQMIAVHDNNNVFIEFENS